MFCSRAGPSCKRRNLGCSSAEGRSSTANAGTKAAVLLQTEGAVASHYFPHPTLSLASEQIWKDPRGTSMEVRRVDLANWALQTSPKFATGVKHQFHQSFWPDQRSGNPNQPSPPWNQKVLTTFLLILIFNELFTFKTSDEWQHWKTGSTTLDRKEIKLLFTLSHRSPCLLYSVSMIFRSEI